MEVIVEASVMRVVTTVCRPSAAGKTKYWGGVGEGGGGRLGNSWNGNIKKWTA